uniref:FimV/HubP family polar landmark protein n=1 Tax=Candidatus Enterovibrio escicola TaxID=1927127 RepID=UPI000BE33A8E|nr:FimV/HubP family polar landmark protein [Candidatus Enterovibrio escacola]
MWTVFEADINNAMKLIFLPSYYYGLLGKILPISSLLVGLISSLPVHSMIRIIGPPDEMSATRSLELLSSARETTSRTRQTVGPTRESDTLWSLATRYQPSDSVTVYQMLGAIFRLNLNAFDDANLHGLVLGSNLIMPTLAEIHREYTDDIKDRLQIDKTRKDAHRLVKLTLSEQVLEAVIPKLRQKEILMATIPSSGDVKVATMGTIDKISPSVKVALEKVVDAGDMKESITPIKSDISVAQDQIQQSDLQRGKLVEVNHILQIRLAEAQNELLNLKNEIKEDQTLTKEIRELLDTQRLHQFQIEMKDKSMFGTLMSSPFILAISATVPALLVICAASFIIMRRRKDNAVYEPKSLDGEASKDMSISMVPELQNETDELVFEEDELEVTDDTDANDLFGESSLVNPDLDDINLSGSLALSAETEEFDSSFDGDSDINALLDVEKKPKGKIGLGDMELTLNKIASSEETQLNPNESPAARWEESLNEGVDRAVDDAKNILGESDTFVDESIDANSVDKKVIGEILEEEDLDLSGTDVLLDELLSEGDGHDLEDESALLKKVSEAALLGDDILSLDDLDNQETVSETLNKDANLTHGFSNLLNESVEKDMSNSVSMTEATNEPNDRVEDDALNGSLEEPCELDEAIPVIEQAESSQLSSSHSLTKQLSSNEQLVLEDEAYQVAGLDMETLLSDPIEDESCRLEGFEPKNWDLPEDENDIWRAKQMLEPELESEDWSDQPEVSGNEIKSINLDEDHEDLLAEEESELDGQSSSNDVYISIEELMKDEDSKKKDVDSVLMNLKVRLEELPDVLSDVSVVDMDNGGESAKNMDIARAYLEMNDIDGALQILQKMMQGDDSNLKNEAEEMIRNLN